MYNSESRLTGTANSDEMVGRTDTRRRSRARVRSVRSGDNIATADSDSSSNSDDRCSSSGRRSSRGRRSTAGVSGSLELGEVVTRVHGKDHSLLAMACLTTIDPNRICINNGELGLREWAIGVIIGNELAEK